MTANRAHLRRGGIACSAALAAALAAVALTATGCGQGTYTREAREQADERAARLRAATEFDMAQQRYETGDLTQALESVDRSIALYDEVARVHVLRARITLEMARHEEAVDSLDRAAELNAADPEVPYFRGIVLEGVNRREQALEAYRQAMALDPTQLQYVIATAEVLMELDRLDEAESVLAGVHDRFQYSPALQQTLGHLATMRGDRAGAVDAFQRAVTLGAEDPALLEDLARAQVATSRFADAEANLRRLMEHRSHADRRDLQHMRARCLLELGRPVEARELLLRLTRDDRGSADVEAWARLADVALMLEDDHQLRSAANRLIAIAPDRHEGYLVLAAWQRRNNDLAGALRSLDRAQEHARANPAPLRMRAIVLRQLGRDAEAQDALRAADELARPGASADERPAASIGAR